MIQRVLEEKDSVILLQANQAVQEHALLGNDWTVAKIATEVLLPLYEATKEMSGQQYITGSLVIPMTRNLLGWYAEDARRREQQADEMGYKLSKALLDCLNRRFHVVEEVKELAVSTLTDPRFKKQGFRSQERADRAARWLKQEMDAGKVFFKK